MINNKLDRFFTYIFVPHSEHEIFSFEIDLRNSRPKMEQNETASN